MSDIESYPLPKNAKKWLSGSPFEFSAVQMGRHLAKNGYSNATIASYLGSIGHLAHWIESEELQIEQVSEDVVEKFVRIHLPVCSCAPRCQTALHTVRAATSCWLNIAYLIGLLAQKPHHYEPLIRHELAIFQDYLCEVKGLQPSTCDTNVKRVGEFLTYQFAGKPIVIEQLEPKHMMDYVFNRTSGWKPASVKALCGALGSYLRFKAASGTSTTKLIAALPRVAQWKLASLPKSLTSDEVKVLLSAFDISTKGGQRDYAIARCYVDLGLRTAEVVRLTLDDIDWRQGVVYIHSKGVRIDALPLPNSTGEAIASYLENRDNKCATRALFLRLRPPFDRPATADTIRCSIRNAAKRCGLSNKLTGPHKLRHTLATRLVNSNVSLKDISDLLRHRNLDTTTIYAKVDMNALTVVSSAWPGESS